MTKQRFDELVDDWRDGFVPENEDEEKIRNEFIECLREIATAKNWQFDEPTY